MKARSAFGATGWLVGLASLTAGQTITEIIDESGDDAGNALINPIGVAVDDSGAAYVAGLGSDNLFKVELDGTVCLLMDSTGGGLGSPLQNPTNPFVDEHGNVFVVGAASNNAFKISPGGVITELIDSQGAGIGSRLNGPVDIAVDSIGNVFVPGLISNNVFKITPAGAISEIIDETGDGLGNVLSWPFRVEVDDWENVYVIGMNSDNAFQITPDGGVTQIIDASGDGSGNDLDKPWGLAISTSGNVFVSSFNTSSIFKITPGSTISKIYQGNPFQVFLSELIVGSSETVYFVELRAASGVEDRVYELLPSGPPRLLIDEDGDGMGNSLSKPSGLAIDSFGSLYVSCEISSNVFKITCGLPTLATSVPYNGTDWNLDSLTANEVLIGHDWSATLSPQATRNPGAWILLVRGEDASGPIVDLGTFLGLPSAGSSELLVNPSSSLALNFSPPAHGGGGRSATFTAHVPINCDLVGQPWYAQAIVTGDLPTGAGAFDPWFSTAVGGIIGNQ